ncbi:NAD(P)-dependent oxidoreductase [Pedobacter cryoconitis]|uniref:Putative NADH-flavin reductase n=1 Tax=Pedobacter cryoconitis TaxID=188932 RepID=A0A327T3L7_9SPHI|nr:NAD(P)H-binding protein [Pedobacter cryoconitis]RAJ35758.1 putative NADH-flavin reductase [Pedobacter cryoconitis]
MKHIAVIGSTGSTGKEVVRLALESNYIVTVIERSPKSAQPQRNLKVIKGDVTDLESLVAALENIDFVISCFGPSNHKKVGNLMSLGTTNIVKACEKTGVKRLVFMSGFVQSDGEEFSFLTRLAIKLLRLYYSDSYKDKVIAEAAIQKSTLDWVIVRAPGLAHSKPTGQYTAGIKTKMSFKLLPYADCAKCLLDAVKEDHWTRQIINLGKS